MMGNSHDQVLNAPSVQLDPGHLDLVELVLGGLLDASALANGILPFWNDPVVRDNAAGQVVLADPDGTALALLGYRWQESDRDAGIPATVRGVRRLARAEHGAFRALRITEPLDNQPVVLFDRAPSAGNLAALMQRPELPSGLRLVLVRHSSEARGPEYAQAMEQLQAAASLFPEAGCGHLILPDGIQAATPLERLSSYRLADFRSGGMQLAAGTDGVVVLFSGLSGSGKSTLARAVQERIHQHLGRRAVLLDGDDIRRFISKGLGFSREDRETNVERIGWIAARIAEVGGIALCAPIAPFAATRTAVSQLVRPVGRYYLVHVSTPLEVCEERDRKGLYAKARAGLLKDFTGIDSPYEVPEDADVTLDLSQVDVPTAADRVLQLLRIRV
ncbi:adenylyl-sulfate kinase [Glutamicibacter sp. MNS18]|uniref:adenylyl-sulfate kinase n=1 Tax=Glutamicibacter sp. MNS18 TaxID=2989817 RepID=UPI002235AF84|nr:adenylyl-sulfate kinase [Glutamicibacter sp. MNS18]MCW4466162.1 adenylyl-sulfate kinase [Glutamicibacter sp. MNS18]